MMSRLKSTLKEVLFYLLSSKSVQNLSVLNLRLVRHLAGRTLRIFFAYLQNDLVSLFDITKATLPKIFFFVRGDDGNVLSEEKHVEMTEDNVSVLLQSKVDELAKTKWAAS